MAEFVSVDFSLLTQDVNILLQTFFSFAGWKFLFVNTNKPAADSLHTNYSTGVLRQKNPLRNVDKSFASFTRDLMKDFYTIVT